MLLNRTNFIVIFFLFVGIPNDGNFIPEISLSPNSFNIENTTAGILLENNLNLIEDIPDTVKSKEIILTHKPEIDYSHRSQETIQSNPANRLALTNRNALQLWSYWKLLLEQSELHQIPIVNALLAEKLRKHPQPEIYQNIGELLQDNDLSIEFKALLLDLLAQIATPSALAQLIDIADLGSNSPLYAFLLQALSRIGDNRWNGLFHEELSPMLQAAWSDPPIADENFLNAVGTALANIGAPSGIEQLLDSVAGKDFYPGHLNAEKDKEIDRIKQQVAYDTLSDEVHNPSAIHVLIDCLSQAELGSPESEICPLALAGINTPQATSAIIDDFRKASSGKKTHVKVTLDKISDPDSLKLVVSASSMPFNSPDVKKEVSDFVTDLAADAGIASSLSDH